MMSARFQAYVRRSTPRSLAGMIKRMNLSMGFPAAPMKSLANNFAVIHDHTTNQWIASDGSFATARQINRQSHKALVLFSTGHQRPSSFANDPVSVRRSSIR
jgi:hypothetical protein